ncbi:Signal transduction histidine kinase [Paenibacillus sp. UNC499MF]|nr:Signal transduction histidine kinase [Paenibacillus sp. UNC499MF]
MLSVLSTIRAKFLIGLFVIFSVSFLLLHHFVVRIIETSNEKIITQDLVQLKNNSSIYVKQAFMINHFNTDDMYFQQMAEEMVRDLNHVTSSDTSAYSVEGELIFASDEARFLSANPEDLQHALNGKTAYRIHYMDEKAEVFYAYPVIVEGKNVGILRFGKDFSLLYEQRKHILDVFSSVTVAIFVAAFVFSYLLSRNITIPLIKLTRASSEVTNGNLNIKIGFRRKDEIGQLAHNFGNMIVQIKKQIQRIKTDRDRLEELNRHRKQFFDNVTHELKTPLTSIIGYAELIREVGSRDEAFFAKGMNHIVNESRRLHEMVLQLLTLSRENGGQDAMETIEAGQILHDVCDGMLLKAQRYNKSVHCEADENVILTADPDKIRQVYINIIDNAIKYGRSPSEVHVKAEKLPECVLISVKNEGDTIPPDALSKIFEPFYRVNGQAEREAGSCGLGLSISKAIVEGMGGTIRMDSAEQVTTVVIELPYEASGEGEAR